MLRSYIEMFRIINIEKFRKSFSEVQDSYVTKSSNTASRSHHVVNCKSYIMKSLYSKLWCSKLWQSSCCKLRWLCWEVYMYQTLKVVSWSLHFDESKLLVDKSYANIAKWSSHHHLHNVVKSHGIEGCELWRKVQLWSSRHKNLSKIRNQLQKKFWDFEGTMIKNFCACDCFILYYVHENQ